MKEFYDDIRDKKNIANMNKSRKTNARRKYGSCVLPSDFLSPGAKKNLNGEVIVYKLNEPISWATFRSYPHDIQVKYLEFLRDEFGANRSAAVEVFGTSVYAINSYFVDGNLTKILPRTMDADSKIKLREWISSFRGPVAPVEEKKPVEKKQNPVSPLPPPMFYNVISSCEMNLSGKASEISQMLYNIFKIRTLV